MRVLFVSQPHIGLGRGGFQSQVVRTKEGLERLGVEIVLHDPWTNPMDHVDLCHLFGPCGPMAPLAYEAKRKGKPVVFSPVLGTGGSSKLWTSWRARISGRVPGLYTNVSLLRRILDLSDRVLALTKEEKSTLQRVFRVPEARIRTIPNGIDPRFSRGDPHPFEERYGISKYVLQVGTFHPIKNQLATILASAGLDVPLVLVGDALVGQEAYMERCRAMAGDRVLFTGRIEHDDPLLASAYAGASVFALPSLSEVMPLSLYEAALAGCRLVVSKNVPVAAEIEKFVDRANPKKPKELRSLLIRNLKGQRRPGLRETVLRMPSWGDVGERILSVYRELLSPEELARSEGP
jgi:glycosyltransferase involved in cell wall biosynthesis